MTDYVDSYNIAGEKGKRIAEKMINSADEEKRRKQTQFRGRTIVLTEKGYKPVGKEKLSSEQIKSIEENIRKKNIPLIEKVGRKLAPKKVTSAKKQTKLQYLGINLPARKKAGIQHRLETLRLQNELERIKLRNKIDSLKQKRREAAAPFQMQAIPIRKIRILPTHPDFIVNQDINSTFNADIKTGENLFGNESYFGDENYYSENFLGNENFFSDAVMPKPNKSTPLLW